MLPRSPIFIDMLSFYESIYLFISFFSALGDTVFLFGVPLYLYQLGNNKLWYAALVPFTIILTIIIFKRFIFAVNHLNPIKLVGVGELAIGLVEILILLLVDSVPRKELLLVLGLIPLALIYNIYSASKRLKVQDYFFKENRVVMNGWHSTCDRLGRVLGVFLAGFLLNNSGIKGILIFDALSFFVFGGFMLFYYRFGDREPAKVTTGPVDEESIVIPNNRLIEMGLFIGLIALNLAASWENSSLLPAVQKVTRLSIETLSGVKAISAGVGMVIGLMILKLRPRIVGPLISMIMALFVVLSVLGISPYIFFVIFSIGFGLLGILLVTLQRGFIKRISSEGKSFSEVATRFWYLQVITSLIVLPLNFGLDHFDFASPYSIAILVCLIVGVFIGAGTSKEFLFGKGGA